MISNKLSHFDKVFGRHFLTKCAFRHSEMIDNAKIGRASSKKRLFFLRGSYVHLFFYWFFQRFLFHILVKPLKMMINAPSLYRRRYHVYGDVWGVELWNGTVMNLAAIRFVEYIVRLLIPSSIHTESSRYFSSHPLQH